MFVPPDAARGGGAGACGALWAGSRPVVVVTGAAARAVETVAELLSAELGQGVHVTPMVVVHGALTVQGGLRYSGVIFLAAGAIPHAVAGKPVIYTSAQVMSMAAAAERPLPPMLEMLPPE